MFVLSRHFFHFSLNHISYPLYISSGFPFPPSLISPHKSHNLHTTSEQDFHFSVVIFGLLSFVILFICIPNPFLSVPVTTHVFFMVFFVFTGYFIFSSLTCLLSYFSQLLQFFTHLFVLPCYFSSTPLFCFIHSSSCLRPM